MSRLGRLGRFCARHHWWVIGAWVVALIGLGALGQGLGGQLNDNLSLPGVKSAQGLTVLQQAFPTQGTAQGAVVVYSATAALDSGAPQAAIAAGAAELRRVPGVLSVTPPQVAPAGHVAQVGIEWSTPPQVR